MLAVLWITLASLEMSYSDPDPGQFGPIPEPVCGQISLMLDNCFNDTIPPVSLDLLYTVKIPDSMEDISGRCLLFNRGMACIEHYLDRCVSQRNRRIVENEVYGARRLYEHLCNDKTFQRDFLTHRQCFHYVHPEWDTCSDQFLETIRDETSHFCCARFSYERCVYESALGKCRNDSALFLQKVAKLLSSERQFWNCDRINHLTCSIGGRVSVSMVLIMLLLLLMVEWNVVPWDD